VDVMTRIKGRLQECRVQRAMAEGRSRREGKLGAPQSAGLSRGGVEATWLRRCAREKLGILATRARPAPWAGTAKGAGIPHDGEKWGACVAGVGRVGELGVGRDGAD